MQQLNNFVPKPTISKSSGHHLHGIVAHTRDCSARYLSFLHLANSLAADDSQLAACQKAVFIWINLDHSPYEVFVGEPILKKEQAACSRGGYLGHWFFKFLYSSSVGLYFRL